MLSIKAKSRGLKNLGEDLLDFEIQNRRKLSLFSF